MRGLQRDSRSEPSRPGEEESISFFSYYEHELKHRLQLCLNGPACQRGTIASTDMKPESEIPSDIPAAENL